MNTGVNDHRVRLEEKGEGGDLLAKLESRDEVSSCDVLGDIFRH